MIKYSFTRFSKNRKTGPIPVTTSTKNTCPRGCIHQDSGCYAENSHTGARWSKLDVTGVDIDALAKSIRKLPARQLWRYGVAGDLPGVDNDIDESELNKIISANRHKKGFSYTHKAQTEKNISIIRESNKKGFTINLSCDSIEQLDENLDIPKVIVIDHDFKEKSFDASGHKIVICPAVIHDEIDCSVCAICANSKRSFVVAFPAHGQRKKKVKNIEVRNIA